MIFIMIFLLTDSPQNLKLETIHDTLIIFFDGSSSSPQLSLMEARVLLNYRELAFCI